MNVWCGRVNPKASHMQDKCSTASDIQNLFWGQIYFLPYRNAQGLLLALLSRIIHSWRHYGEYMQQWELNHGLTTCKCSAHCIMFLVCDPQMI